MDIKRRKDVTTEVEEICYQLEKRSCDSALILLNRSTGEVSTYGSSIGISFFARNPSVVTMFTDFYVVFKKELENETTGGKSVNNNVNNEEKSVSESNCSALSKNIRFEADFVSEAAECETECPVKDENTEKSTRDKNEIETVDENCFPREKLSSRTGFEKPVTENDSNICLQDSLQSGQDNNETENNNLSEINIEEFSTFECKQCGKTFKSRAGLSTHEKYIHDKFKCERFTMLEYNEKNVKLLYINKEGKETTGLRCSMYEKKSENASTRFRCTICSFSTEKYNGIVEHTQTHVIKDLLTCSLCDKSFKVKKSLWRHTQQHKKLPHMCKTCLKMFEKKEDLELHQVSHNSSHVCDICDRKYDCIGRLNYHKKLSHGPKLIKCEICSASYSSKSLLKQHMKRHGPKQFFCDKCSCSYFFMHQLTNHLKTHDENSIKYKCTVCPREYVNLSHWKEHMKLHDGSNFVKCDQCSKSYSSRKALNLHKKTKHVEERKFVCQVCDKAFITKHHLKNHLICHDVKRDYKCRFCEATFKKNDVLKMHENVHTKERKFICDICGEHFLRRSSLRNHRLTHFPGLGRWKCRYCDHKFRTQSVMMTHIKNRHADEDLAHERPLCRKCRQCGKIYAKGLTFRIHMDMHAGIKRYKCRFCGNAFTDPANLRVHMKTHDGTVRFKRHVCDRCDTRYSSVKQLRLHMTTHDKSKLYEDQNFQRLEQQKCLDLSSLDNKQSEGAYVRDGSFSHVLGSEDSKKTVGAESLQAMGDLESGLMPLHDNHGLVNIGHQVLNRNSFSNSGLLTTMNSAEIVNSRFRLDSTENKIAEVNFRQDHRYFRTNGFPDNISASTSSSDQCEGGK